MEYLQSQGNDATHKSSVNIPHSIHVTLTLQSGVF